MDEEKFSPVCGSVATKQMYSMLDRVLNSSAPIFITGETGVGKEVVANYVHRNGNRSQHPCLKINCAALPRELIESELFGSVKGSYTGANSDKVGLFRSASFGVLVLDEIGEMDILAQTKLLRVLQDRKVRPVGGVKDYDVDCRIIASTNKDPKESIRDGKLRPDLFYRLNVIPIRVPALRERKEEISFFIDKFLEIYNKEENKNVSISKSVKKDLSELDWPGNVRQLENTIRRIVIVNDGKEVTYEDFNIFDDLDEEAVTLEENEERIIQNILVKSMGNVAKASKYIDIPRNTLYRKIKKYNLEGCLKSLRK